MFVTTMKGQVFCPVCGAPLSQSATVMCPQCGSELNL